VHFWLIIVCLIVTTSLPLLLMAWNSLSVRLYPGWLISKHICHSRQIDKLRHRYSLSKVIPMCTKVAIFKVNWC